MARKQTAPKAGWVPELITEDGVRLTLNALRWRRMGAATLSLGTWKETRLHYLRRLKLQLGLRGVVADSTLPKGKPPGECVEAELISSWTGTDGEGDGTDEEVAISRLTLLYFQRDGADAMATLAKLVGKMTWADVARVIAA